jgi:hypothetical protein
MKPRPGELCNIRDMAECHQWTEIDHQENIKMVSFAKDSVRINVYYSRMTVAIAENRTQIFTKNVTEEMLGKIFQQQSS